MQKRNSILYISFILVTLTMLTAFVVSELPRSEYDVFVGKVTRNLRKCMGAREAGREEYRDLREKTEFVPSVYRSLKQNDNIFVRVEKSDVTFLQEWMEKNINFDIGIEECFLYDYVVFLSETKMTRMYIEVYSFVDKESTVCYFEYLKDIEEQTYSDNRFQNRMGASTMEIEGDKVGLNSSNAWIFSIYDVSERTGGFSERYHYCNENMVVTIACWGEKQSDLYEKYREFLQQMQFEGIDDIVLEPVEIVD